MCAADPLESGEQAAELHVQARSGMGEKNMSTSKAEKKKKLTVTDLVYIAVFAGMMAICSWISIPAAVPFTMQTFAVFIAFAVLGGRRGAMAVLVYILMGAVGLPVFAGFTGGIGALAGTSGGYIIGFLGSALVMWGLEKIVGRKTIPQFLAMLLGLLVCYAFGTAWFMVVYMASAGAVGRVTVLGWCVLPFSVPDILKILLALALGKRIRRYTGLR